MLLDNLPSFFGGCVAVQFSHIDAVLNGRSVSNGKSEEFMFPMLCQRSTMAIPMYVPIMFQ